MTNLSDHLTLEDFVKSNTATRDGIDNSLPDELLETAKYTAQNLFEPIRELLGGVPLPVDSGYRCEALNTAVRGVPTSEHVLARALDMVPSNMTPLEAFNKIKNSNLIWNQLILEHTSSGVYWVHASIVDGKNKQQVIPTLLKSNN